jgi:hypothetical protein
LMNNSAGRVSMSKSFFWPMFKRAWDKAFTEANIQAAFCKPGIWPTDSTNIIQSITRPFLVSPKKSGPLRTPKSAKAIRRFHIAYDKSPTVDKVKTIFATTLRLAAQVSILEHENRGLYKAIELQKKKGKKGVRLNLKGEPNKDIVDCYSPAQVVKAREYQEQKEALEAAEEEAKLQRKIQRAANALKKAKEREEREARAAAKQLVKDLQAANQAAKKAPLKKQVSVVSKAKKATPPMSKKQKAPAKAKALAQPPVEGVVVSPIEGVVASEVVVANRRGRAIRLPERFKEKN